MKTTTSLAALVALASLTLACDVPWCSDACEPAAASGSVAAQSQAPGAPIAIADADADDADDRDEVDADGAEDEGEVERAIPVDSVPAAGLAAARAAVPGATFDAAEVEEEDGGLVYSLSGTVNGAPVEVEVNAAGKVLEIEQD